MSPESEEEDESGFGLPRKRPGLAWTLGFGAFGLVFALTITAAYLPPVPLGPLVAGGAIDAASGFLGQTDGYEVLWPVCGLPVLAAIPLVRRLRAAEQRAEA